MGVWPGLASAADLKFGRVCVSPTFPSVAGGGIGWHGDGTEDVAGRYLREWCRPSSIKIINDRPSARLAGWVNGEQDSTLNTRNTAENVEKICRLQSIVEPRPKWAAGGALLAGPIELTRKQDPGISLLEIRRSRNSHFLSGQEAITQFYRVTHFPQVLGSSAPRPEDKHPAAATATPTAKLRLCCTCLHMVRLPICLCACTSRCGPKTMRTETVTE